MESVIEEKAIAKRAARKRWAQRNREYFRDWARKHRLNPEVRKRDSERTRAWQKRNPVQHALLNYKGSAKRKGLEFSVPLEMFEELLNATCHYCGAPPSPINGIDRIDNTHGYVAGNLVTACDVCNYAKRKLSVREFAEWVKRISSNLHKWSPDHGIVR